MFTAVQIINIGLSKIGASRISDINPPRSSLERFNADNYDHWKRSELAKRRWVFALEENYALPHVETLTNVERPYKYELPTKCLRPVRERHTEWRQRKRFIFSAYPGLRVTFIENVTEPEFGPMFVEVLAARIAMENVEYNTQSNTKFSTAKAMYDEAVTQAGQMNAYVVGPEDVADEDENFDFVTSRW